MQEEKLMLIYVRNNLIMRCLAKSDTQAKFAVVDRNRLYLREWLPWVDDVKTADGYDGIIESWNEDYKNGKDIVLGIFENGEYVGNFGLHCLRSGNKSGMIGYWLDGNRQGRGIISDCVRAINNYAFHTLELNRTYINCAEGNAKSRAIPERLGYVQEGILQDGECLYSVYHNEVVYGLVKRNWTENGTLALVTPTAEHEEQAMEYKREHDEHGEHHIHGSSGFYHAENYGEWLEKVIAGEHIIYDDLVRCSTYFAVVDGKIVGTISVRHKLNDSLLKNGGHIGYGVRPTERRKGYASKMLILALAKCNELGIEKALVTCDKNNIASRQTILTKGGVMENEIMDEEGNMMQRYWINIGGRP
jgi:ribosomal-protein-serine acetyltransferase